MKDHGEGGIMTGTSLQGQCVIILNDFRETVHGAINTVRKYGGEVVGVLQVLDKEEVGRDGTSSMVKEIE